LIFFARLLLLAGFVGITEIIQKSPLVPGRFIAPDFRPQIDSIKAKYAWKSTGVLRIVVSSDVRELALVSGIRNMERIVDVPYQSGGLKHIVALEE
jgi:hypothetical protein